MMKYFLILGFLLVHFVSNSQGLDTSLMLIKAKVCLLEFSEPKSKDQIFNFFEDPLPFKLLSSKGFSNHIFFVEIPISYDSITKYNFVYNYKFVLAFNSKSETIYRIKGFFQNEFNTFIEDAQFANNIDYLVAEYRDLSSLRRFTQSFYIEGLDMKCLYKSLKKSKKTPDCLAPAQKIIH
jgi:hypothetical protein